MLADLTAVKSGTVTLKMLSGVATLFGVPNKAIDGATLKREWTAEGLNPKLIPDARQAVHVFMAAASSVATGKRGSPTDRDVEISADLVSHDSTSCVYQITRLVRDRAAQVIDHPKAMTLVFDKATQDISCIPRDPESYLALSGIEEQVREHFQAHTTKVEGSKVRNAVRQTLVESSGTSLRGESGGAYFIPIKHYGTVESLQNVLERLYPDTPCMTVWPVLNTDATRRLIEQHHTIDVREAAEKMVADIHNRMANDGTQRMRRDYVANRINERVTLGRKVREYEALLGGEIAAVNEAMEMLDDQIDKLMAAAA